jgi:hypothetical protein
MWSKSHWTTYTPTIQTAIKSAIWSAYKPAVTETKLWSYFFTIINSVDSRTIDYETN